MTLRFLALVMLALPVGCSGSVETRPSQDEDDDASGGSGNSVDDPGSGGITVVPATGGGVFGTGGAVSTGGVSRGGSPAGGTVMAGNAGAATGGATTIGGAAGGGGGPGTGDIIGEFHFSFTGEPYSNQEVGDGVRNVTIVPLPDTATVTADLAGATMVTGVAGSMPLLLSACEQLADGRESCTLEIVSFGGSPSGMGAPGEFPFDGRLGTFAKQQTFTTTVLRDGDAWSLPPTDLGLILDVSTKQGTTSDQNDTGAGPAFITVDVQTGTTQHQLWIESFEVSCDGDYCEVDFSAYERE